MKKLIVNADDFGYSRGLNLGIVDAHMNGIVTSTTMLTTMPGFEHGVELAKKHPSLGIGIHLSVDLGKPVLPVEQIPTLVNDEGTFIRHKFQEYNLGIDPTELFNEWCAQIEKAQEAGINITHLDSHHHAHMHKEIFPTFIKVAHKFDLPIRYGDESMPGDYLQEFDKLLEDTKYVDHFYGSFYDTNATVETLEEQLKTGAKSIEIMCHPAYLDASLLNGSSYNKQRLNEIDVLMSPQARKLVERYDYKLVNYSEI